MWLPLIRSVEHDGISGIAIRIVESRQPETEVEVGRVAFIRNQSRNPKTTFGEQLANIVAKADQACELANDLQVELDRQQDIHRIEFARENDRITGETIKQIKAALKPLRSTKML